MASIASGLSTQGTRSVSNEISAAFSSVDTDQFLNLMLTELQNQDPLDPTDSGEFLQQITQIREIGASDRLTSTLDRVLAGQNLATASALIGKEVVGRDEAGTTVTGVADRVRMETDAATGAQSIRVFVGDRSFPVEGVEQIVQV